MGLPTIHQIRSFPHPHIIQFGRTHWAHCWSPSFPWYVPFFQSFLSSVLTFCLLYSVGILRLKLPPLFYPSPSQHEFLRYPLGRTGRLLTSSFYKECSQQLYTDVIRPSSYNDDTRKRVSSSARFGYEHLCVIAQRWILPFCGLDAYVITLPLLLDVADGSDLKC